MARPTDAGNDTDGTETDRPARTVPDGRDVTGRDPGTAARIRRGWSGFFGWPA